MVPFAHARSILGKSCDVIVWGLAVDATLLCTAHGHKHSLNNRDAPLRQPIRWRLELRHDGGVEPHAIDTVRLRLHHHFWRDVLRFRGVPMIPVTEQLRHNAGMMSSPAWQHFLASIGAAC